MYAQSRFGRIDLDEDHLVIKWKNDEGITQRNEVVPLLRITSVTLKKSRFLNGHIRLNLLRDNRTETSLTLQFEGNNITQFESIKKSVEEKILEQRTSVLNSQHLKVVETKIEQVTKPKLELANWLEKNEELLKEGLDVVKEGIQTWEENQNRKLTLKENELNISNEQSRRGIYLLSGFIIAIFLLCTIALYKEQYELVKWILSSTFAAGAGAGIRAMFAKKNK